MFLGLTRDQIKKLEYEVISERARLKFTRLLRNTFKNDNTTLDLIYKNKIVNIARNGLGLPIYRLETEDGEYYYPAEHAWHYAELELVMRRPKTDQLVELLADFIQEEILEIKTVNGILRDEGASMAFYFSGHDQCDLMVNILPIEEIEEIEDTSEHPNIRKLIKRMEDALKNDDFSAVLHASASVFETLAKDIINLDSIENESLGSFFGRYRIDSALPAPILDYILDIFNKRSTVPLAGHGSRMPSNISDQEAIIIAEMTKSFVRIERQLANPSLIKEDNK